MGKRTDLQLAAIKSCIWPIRMEILRLYPLAQSELAGTARTFLDALFGHGFKARSYARFATPLGGHCSTRRTAYRNLSLQKGQIGGMLDLME